jgi:predicted metal-dependent hydrolase
MSVLLVRNRRARRYVLRLRSDGRIRITIPCFGTVNAALAFARQHTAWIERRLQQWIANPPRPTTWRLGAELLFRGRLVRLDADPENPRRVRLDTEVLRVADAAADLRPEIERHLRRLASRELPVRLIELAGPQHTSVRRITVRNQRSRWGSCSRRGTISLNWRLIQAPEFVRDYIILHELAHLAEMNHSRRFWGEVERLCPDYRRAERWLKENRTLLR